MVEPAIKVFDGENDNTDGFCNALTNEKILATYSAGPRFSDLSAFGNGMIILIFL